MTTEKRIVALETALQATKPRHELRDDLSDLELSIAYLSYAPGTYEGGDPNEARRVHAWLWGVLVYAFGPEAYAPLGFHQPPSFQQILETPGGQLKAHCRRLSQLAADSPSDR